MSRLSTIPMQAMARPSRIANPQPSLTQNDSKNETGSVFDFENSNKKTIPKLENTFQISPSFRIQTQLNSIEKHAKSCLDTILMTTPSYDAVNGRNACKSACSSIHKHIKTLKIDRYRFCVSVFVGEYGNFDIRHGSKCLWNDKFDTFVSVASSQTNKGIYATATVYLVYMD